MAIRCQDLELKPRLQIAFFSQGNSKEISGSNTATATAFPVAELSDVNRLDGTQVTPIKLLGFTVSFANVPTSNTWSHATASKEISNYTQLWDTSIYMYIHTRKLLAHIPNYSILRSVRERTNLVPPGEQPLYQSFPHSAHPLTGFFLAKSKLLSSKL